MLDAAVTHKGRPHDVDMLKALHGIMPYCPQLLSETTEFGADYIDNILPVKHMSMKWNDYVTSLTPSHLCQDDLPYLQ